MIDLWRRTWLSDASNGGTPGMVTGGEGAVRDTFEGDGASYLAEEAYDLRQENCPGRGGSGWPLRDCPKGSEPSQADGSGKASVISAQGTDGWGGANEAVFPPTHQDSDGWLMGRRQVLAHGPLGRVENSMSLNVTVGHSDCWPSREGGHGLWGAVKGIPERTVSPLAPFVSQTDGISKLKRIEQPYSPACSLSKQSCTGPEMGSKLTKLTIEVPIKVLGGLGDREEKEMHHCISVLTYWRLEKGMVLTSCLAFEALMFYWHLLVLPTL